MFSKGIYTSHSYQKSTKVLARSYLKLEKNKLNEIKWLFLLCIWYSCFQCVLITSQWLKLSSDLVSVQQSILSFSVSWIRLNFIGMWIDEEILYFECIWILFWFLRQWILHIKWNTIDIIIWFVNIVKSTFEMTAGRKTTLYFYFELR